jgi:hypothetical protein
MNTNRKGFEEWLEEKEAEEDRQRYDTKDNVQCGVKGGGLTVCFVIGVVCQTSILGKEAS